MIRVIKQKKKKSIYEEEIGDRTLPCQVNTLFPNNLTIRNISHLKPFYSEKKLSHPFKFPYSHLHTQNV